MASISNDIVTFSSNVNPEHFAKFLKSPQWEHWKNSQDPDFKYHSIRVDAITMFGPNPGLIHITTNVTFNGLTSDRVVFIRGGAVGIYVRLRSKQTKKVYVVYVRQPRNAVGKKSLREIIAGMLDGATGTLPSKNVAAKELKEEGGFEILASDLHLLGTGLPSPGGCDEWIDLYSVFLDADDDFIQSLLGKQTGEIGSDEQITMEICEVEEFKTMLLDGRCQDFKAMSAIMMLDTLIARGYDDKPSRDLTPSTTTDDTYTALPADMVSPTPALPPQYATFASPALARVMSGLGSDPNSNVFSNVGGGLAATSSASGFTPQPFVGLSNFTPVARTGSVSPPAPLARSSSVAMPAPFGRTSSVAMPAPLARASSLAPAPSLSRSMTTGIGGLGATSSASADLPRLEEDHDDHDQLVKDGLGHFRVSENFSQEDKDKILRCPLHATPRINPGGLWYAPNDMGYSTFSPPCNGCKDGQAERHLWMSGFGYDPHEQTPPDGGLAPTSSVGDLAPTSSVGGGLAPTASSGGLAPTSSI